jgi:hypothetical protein
MLSGSTVHSGSSTGMLVRTTSVLCRSVWLASTISWCEGRLRPFRYAPVRR